MNKIKKVAIIGHYNLYESKLHFSRKLAEALERKGIEVLFVDMSDHEFDAGSFMALKSFGADLSLSFNSSSPDARGKFLWDYLQTPHLSILVDPPVYYMEMSKSPLSIFSCVDELDVAWLKSKKMEKSFFLPHAIEKELKGDPAGERPYEVVFLGSCYDIEELLKTAKKKFDKALFSVIKKSIKRVRDEFASPFEFVIEEELKKIGLEVPYKTLVSLCSTVDTYLRGEERLELIRHIQSAEVHIFGESGWQDEYSARPWQELLAGQKNVVFHPTVSYPASLEILKKSKISLNSMPFFKKGTHERLFASLAAGSVPLSTNNLWIEENFLNNEELLTFSPHRLNEVDAQIRGLLDNEKKRQEIALRGQAKTLAHHTWDNRAETLLEHCS